MTASSVPMPHIPTAFLHGMDLGKPPSHEGRVEEGDGGRTVGPAEEEDEARMRVRHRKKVRTVPPFAAFDPPSPVQSPRLGPTEPRLSTSATARAASPSLTPVLSNLALAAAGGEYDNDEMQQPSASWWTFSKPGRWKQVQSLHNAWHEQMQANQELRRESEHLGKDYFASKRGSTTAAAGEPDLEMQQPEDEGGMMTTSRPPFGMSSSGMHSHMGSYFHLPIKLRRRSASTEDIRNPNKVDDMSRRSSVHGVPANGETNVNFSSSSATAAAATPPRVETPTSGAAKTRRTARFKAMSLPASRRPSTDGMQPRPFLPPTPHDPPFITSIPGTVNPSKNTRAPHVDGFSLGPPIGGVQDAQGALSPVVEALGTSRRRTEGGSSAPSTPPPRTVESPEALRIELPAPPPASQRVVSPRRAHYPQLSITMPPPVFVPSAAANANHPANATSQHAPITTTTDMPPPMFQRRMYQAQAPPTPHGWEAPWREDGHRSHVRKHASRNPRGPLEGVPQHAHRHRGTTATTTVDDPWLQPFEETAWEGDDDAGFSPGADSPGREGEGHRGRQAGAGGSDSSGPFSGISEKSGRRLAGGTSNASRRSRSRHSKKGTTGAKERALTKWAALRRSAVENPPGTRRTKLRDYLMFDARSTLYLRMLTLVGVITSLGLGAKLFQLEEQSDLDGILGSAPILSISYGSVSAIHCLVVMYREAFGKPIGLWEVRSKMLWVCLDLFFISLWSSDLSLTISDYMSTPLQCASRNPWWTSNDYSISLPSVITKSSQKDDMCNRQAALIAVVLFTLIMYVFGMVISLFRIFVRLSTVAKSYEQKRSELV